MRCFDIDAGGSFEDLDDCFLALDFEDLTAAFGSVWESEFDDFVVGWELEVS